MQAIHLVQKCSAIDLNLRRDRPSREQIADGIPLAAGPERHTLVDGGQKTISPITRRTSWHSTSVRQHDIGG